MFRDKIERMVWERHAETLLPDNAGYLWSLATQFAEGRIGLVIHKGDIFFERRDAAAEALLTELGVKIEHRWGYRYIAGKRVYWDSRRQQYTQDDYRPCDTTAK
jgi:hypothetical protein